MTDPIAVTASAISLANYLLTMVDEYNDGKMSAEEFSERWGRLQVRRELTKGIWQDAKRARES